MGSAAQNILRLLQKVRSIMKTLVLVLVLSVASGSPVLMDTLEVAAEKEKFAAAFKAAEAGEHAKLAPVNTDVQEPAPVFVGKQIPEAFLEDTAPVAEARSLFTAAFEDAAAGGLAAKQAPAPEFTGEQIADSYLEDFAPVAEARAAFKAAFDDAAAGGLAAKQAPAPALPATHVAAVKSAAVIPLAAAPAVGAPLVYTHHYPYTYHTLTAPKVVSYTGLTHPHALPLTYTHTLPYAGFYPLPLPVKVPLDSNSVEESVA